VQLHSKYGCIRCEVSLCLACFHKHQQHVAGLVEYPPLPEFPEERRIFE